MAKITKEYPVVDRLPEGAKRLKQYAEDHGFKLPYLYNKNYRLKIHIVNFQGTLFVIPKSEN